jgi:glycosyltransferase involved in cell wall biosynthesis
MKLAILTQYYPPEMGAPQARLSELAQRFAERGHEVIVLTALPNYPRGKIYPGYKHLYQRDTQNGIPVIRSYIYPTKSVKMVRRLTSYFSFVFSSSVIGSLALPNIDYLLTESPPLFLGMGGYLLSRLKRARWIFNVSDLWPESAVHLGAVSEGWGLQAAYALEAFCYRKAWLVTGQSHGILESVQGRFPHVRTYHLSNGVDTTRFTPLKHSIEFRNRLLSDNVCIAIYAGLHGIAQGLDQILEGATHLQNLSGCQIVLIGDGPEKERLVNMSEDMALKNVHFHDPVSHGSIPELLASSDIALVPLKKTLPGAVPSKLYEAMASGLPVILIAEGEPARIVNEIGCGITVQPGDTKSLVEALKQLAENPAKRQQLGQIGRNTAIARFDRQQIADSFIDYLDLHI